MNEGKHLLASLEHLYVHGPFSTRSTFARENPEVIAEGAIRGLLTTQTPSEGFGRYWRLTALGVHELGLKNPALKDIK